MFRVYLDMSVLVIIIVGSLILGTVLGVFLGRKTR